MPMQGGSLYHFYDGLWYGPAERRTHDLPCESRTRYRLSQPDTVGQPFVCTNVTAKGVVACGRDGAKETQAFGPTFTSEHCCDTTSDVKSYTNPKQ